MEIELHDPQCQKGWVRSHCKSCPTLSGLRPETIARVQDGRNRSSLITCTGVSVSLVLTGCSRDRSNDRKQDQSAILEESSKSFGRAFGQEKLSICSFWGHCEVHFCWKGRSLISTWIGTDNTKNLSLIFVNRSHLLRTTCNDSRKGLWCCVKRGGVASEQQCLLQSTAAQTLALTYPFDIHSRTFSPWDVRTLRVTRAEGEGGAGSVTRLHPTAVAYTRTWWDRTTGGSRRAGPATQASGASGLIRFVRWKAFFSYRITLMQRKNDLLEHVAHHLETRVHNKVYETCNTRRWGRIRRAELRNNIDLSRVNCWQTSDD